MSWLTSLFANPWMLAWLPAAAAPIIIHLWNRRKYREMSWAAMEYLLAAIIKSSKRMRIEQLILLLVRIALIAMVVLALAEPFLSAVASPFISGARTHRVIAIDGSYSMAFQPADKSVWTAAQERATQIVENSNEGDAFSLILMAEPPRVIVGSAAYDRAEFIEEIENLRMLHGGADLPAALQATEDLIRQVGDDQSQLRQHQVYFLSDLGLNTWGKQQRTGAAGEQFDERLKRLNETGVVEVVPLGKPGAENVAITDLRVAESYAVVAQPVTIMATIRNFSSQPRSHQLAELWIDGRRMDQQFVDILPGEETPPVVFNYRFQTPGDHAVEVRLGGDPLDVDNHRYLVLPVKEHLDALLVSGKRGSTLPFEAALDGGDFSRGLRGTIQPHVVAESAILELDLPRYDCIFLCNVGQFTSSEAQVLDAYVRQGGGLVTILGDQVSADDYNRELTGVDDSPQLLPAKIGDPFFDGNFHLFDPLGYRHPMLEPWRGNPKTGIEKVPVLKYFKLTLAEKSQANVVLALDTGDPLIVEQSIGRGSSILVATDISISSVIDANRHPWSMIASWLNSQPFIAGLWKAAVGGRIDERNVEVGEAFGGRYEMTSGDGRIYVTTPSGPVEKIPPATESDAGRWSFGETDFSGIYTVRAGAENAAPQLFAVNVNTRESDLEKLHPEDLPEGFTMRSEWQDVETMQSVDLPSPTLTLHKTLLYIVLGLLFTEIGLAWWIGHRSA